jgi:hypothetical protein
MLQSISENNKYVNFGITAAKNVGKVTATSTMIIPMALGARELYRGYIPNDICYLPNNTENSTIKKIIRCISPILAFKLGCDLMWSKYSYRKISDGSPESLNEIPLRNIREQKFKLFLRRNDTVQLINRDTLDNFLQLGFSRTRVEKFRLKTIFDNISDEEASSYIKDLIDKTDKTPFSDILSSASHEKILEAFQGLSDDRKKIFFNFADTIINFDCKSFVNLLKPSDIILLDIHKNRYDEYWNQKTNIINILKSPHVDLEVKKEIWTGNFLMENDKNSILFHEPDIIAALGIHDHSINVSRLTDRQLNNMLFSEGGTGLTPKLFNRLPWDRQEKLNFLQVPLTRKNNLGNYIKVSIEEWVSKITLSTCTDEQLVSLYMRIEDDNFRAIFRRKIRNHLRFGRSSRILSEIVDFDIRKNQKFTAVDQGCDSSQNLSNAPSESSSIEIEEKAENPNPFLELENIIGRKKPENDFMAQHIYDWLQKAKQVDGNNKEAINSMFDELKELLICPITYEGLENPQICSDNHTYEKEAIEKWITQNGTSPFNRELITKMNPNEIVNKVLVWLNENHTTLSQ